MAEDTVLQINDALWIPRAELGYKATRAGGPGGQHVNTSSSRVELTWNVQNSPSITDEQRALIQAKLANRISGEGVLLIAASDERSQHQNKELVTERFAELIRRALIVPKARRKTRMPRAAKEARLKDKKQRSATKRSRGAIRSDE
ncbi:alternative ribosome rescue aminoacyl-tRNA hydrolase ArfB [Longimicrobium terrae]|uniref:Ribosome-associated protein n=1 Tax=Longimicrobium terrae TaxID=1639882 RepID=A0A841GZN2_9BACT|nr:alternative ribosome rescue aminoacyl-tRNA hydrolase ArfB [Longimicrobium terrae]MBB4636789.1 ribosome-associated protein [Longimicrobium terrae]MBB6071212.1 ribosome-associated protein [Longimicrobium terrae]NNC29258.1 aminoacyl-tRNA hydrolase [Longimicrobium terrae]